MRSIPLCPLLLCAALSAQGLHVVPAGNAGSDAPGMLGAAGVGVSERQQILIDASHLAPLVGRSITGLVFRRDASFDDALSGASGTLTIRIGTSPNSTRNASSSFAANLPNPTEVFRGPVVAPASPATAARTVGWAAPDIVEVSFPNAWTYTGGTLCIDLDGAGAPDSWWPVDATEQLPSGRVTAEGAACGTRAALLGQTAFVAAADLEVGRTAICKLFGEPGSSAFLLVGADVRPQPIDLAVLGSPGCWLHVDPISAIPAQLSPELTVTIYGGVANVNLHLPPQPQLLGAGFALQWVELQSGRIVTSNGLRCTIAPDAPSLGMAVVWQRPGGRPVIDTARAPVVGLNWQ